MAFSVTGISGTKRIKGKLFIVDKIKYRAYRSKMRAGSDAYRVSHRKYMQKYRSENLIARAKHRARNAVHSAIRKGDILRTPCEVCGESPTHGHHEDYGKPLQVIWLCREHHREKHNLSINSQS